MGSKIALKGLSGQDFSSSPQIIRIGREENKI